MRFEIDSNVSLERLPRPEHSYMEQKSLLLNVSGQPFYAQSFTKLFTTKLQPLFDHFTTCCPASMQKAASHSGSPNELIIATQH